ncbi:MAG TPA: hypothetical protein OIM11_01935 [Coriobacteriaceae bacterium]|nr:hypothetical protein [Coriobacteriaceae bacterium]
MSDSERSREISPAADMSPERLLAALLSVVKREDAATGALLSVRFAIHGGWAVPATLPYGL